VGDGVFLFIYLLRTVRGADGVIVGLFSYLMSFMRFSLLRHLGMEWLRFLSEKCLKETSFGFSFQMGID